MTEYYTYTKKRRDFGRQCVFTDTHVTHCGYFTQKEYKTDKERQEAEDIYKKRNPNFIQLDNISELSQHSVNTERVKTGEKGMYHKEGGWPSNVDPSEQQETNKYKKKIDKDPAFAQSTKDVVGVVERCVKQNNQIDMFEEYFENEISDHVVENLSTKTIMLFKDHSEICKRSVSEISWHPENHDRLAASYAINRFQQMPEKMETKAFIWNLSNPNEYELELHAPSPVTNMSYNHKNVDILGGGCYNGLLAFWDSRKGSAATNISPVELSHADPITHFQWVTHRLGCECVTSSTDGKCMWWDIRKLDQGPIETLDVMENQGEEGASLTGATSIEYNNEAGPNKYLVGTEQGLVLTANKKLKNKVDITTKYGLDSGRHLGPVYSIHRSPVAPKYFMSVGDWSAKIWVEDLKQPIIRTKYHGAYLSDGCWSPTRAGAFFLTRRDGWLDVWDYYYRQNEVAFSHKVSDAPLSCLKINTHPAQQGGASHAGTTGKYVAIGDQDGTVTILELCDSLYHPQVKEKDIIAEMFEREFRKEKNLEQIKKQQELARKVVPKDNTAAREKWEKRKAELIGDVENNFNEMLKKAEEMRLDDDLKELDSPTQSKNQIDEGDEQNQEASQHSHHTDHQQKEESQEQSQEQQQQEAMVEKIMNIKTSNPGNIMAQAFDKEYYDSLSPELKKRLIACCVSGIENPDSQMGCYANQPGDYDDLKPFFNKALEMYHKVDLTQKKHENNWNLEGHQGLPEGGLLDLEQLGFGALSMRVRTGRNLKKYPLPASMTKDDRINMEKDMKPVFDSLIAKPEFGGKYVSITPGHENFVDEKGYQELVDAHIMFKDMSKDSFLMTAGIARDWPNGRGCYVSEDREFIIWVGEEDHLRIMAMQKGTILNKVFDRLKGAIDVVEQLIPGGCAYGQEMGVVTSCPTNAGTGMRASVHVALPNLTSDGTEAKAKQICKPLGLSVRGIGGEHTPIGADGTVDISPSARFCITEAEIMIALYKGLELLKKEEDAAAVNKDQ